MISEAKIAARSLRRSSNSISGRWRGFPMPLRVPPRTDFVSCRLRTAAIVPVESHLREGFLIRVAIRLSPFQPAEGAADYGDGQTTGTQGRLRGRSPLRPELRFN